MIWEVSKLHRAGLLLLGLATLTLRLHGQPAIVPLSAPMQWHGLEFGITNIPLTVKPFDPSVIRLDALIQSPSNKTFVVPAFWYQQFQRALIGGYEHVTPAATPGWRLRFTPPEAGPYTLSLTCWTNGVLTGPPVTLLFTAVSNDPNEATGYVQIGSSGQYFQTSTGQALPLIGENMDWPTTGEGTFQYDGWFAKMQDAGENYARIMMTPWDFGVETEKTNLANYRLDEAWKLDQVFNLAEQHGIYLLLCFDIHDMWQPVPDYWGIYFWPSNPYNATNGGPCINQNAFFTNTTAQSLYQKRLRYLVARYGYSRSLLAWQLLSEIDNEYDYLDAASVAQWHAIMGGWLHTNDPMHHLVTTSLWRVRDRPEIWGLPAIDFTTFHSYNDANPAYFLAAQAQTFLREYRKPFLVDEFGTSGASWGRTNDPFLRGFRQGLWGSALGGAVGTSMAWWWDSIDAENVYGLYASIKTILGKSGWGVGSWTNVDFHVAGPSPVTVGDPLPEPPFTLSLVPNWHWGLPVTGRMAIVNPIVAANASETLDSFLLGSWFPDIAEPFALSAWFTNNARIVLHINSVSDSAGLAVRLDGVQIFQTNLPNANGSGSNAVNNSYNLDLPFSLPAGKHLVELTNSAQGWVFLDWVRLEQVLPATYAGNWQPGIAALGLQGSHEALVYATAPQASFPQNATNSSLPIQHGLNLALTNWPAGIFLADFYDPATALKLGRAQTVTTNSLLTVKLPDFSEDIAAVIYSLPRLGITVSSAATNVQLRLSCEPGGQYMIQTSSNLVNWTDWLTVTNNTGDMVFNNPAPIAQSFFYRARKLD